MTVTTLTVESTNGSIETTLHADEDDALAALRSNYGLGGEYDDVPQDELIQTLIDEQGLLIYVEEHEVPLKVETLVVRDPDGGTDLTMYVDGHEFTGYTGYTVDAGAGHLASEWDAETATIEANTSLTRAFRDAVVEARQDPPGSQYITDSETDEEEE